MGLKLSEIRAGMSDVMQGLILPHLMDDKHMVVMTQDGIRERIYQQCKHFRTICDSEQEFYTALRGWSELNCARWEDVFRTLLQKYELLNNYDRTEERKVVYKGNETASKNSSFNSTGKTEESGNSERIGKVAGYNADSFTNKDSDVATGGNVSNSRSGGVSSDEDKRKKESEIVHSVRAFGNIGVTTAQQMIREEREIAAFSFSDMLLDEFKKEFCIMVY